MADKPGLGQAQNGNPGVGSGIDDGATGATIDLTTGSVAGARTVEALNRFLAHLAAAQVALEAADDGDGPQRARQEIAAAVAAHHVFAAAAAHDLRNPLAGVRGQIQLLQRRSRRAKASGGTLSEEQWETGLAAMDDGIGRLNALIGELLDDLTA